MTKHMLSKWLTVWKVKHERWVYRLSYVFGCFSTYYTFSQGQLRKRIVFSHSVGKVLCCEVGWDHLHIHFAFSRRQTQLYLVGADSHLSVLIHASFPAQFLLKGDSPSTMFLQIQRGLSSPFELPLTPNFEETGGWLRLRGIYFILSTCTIVKPGLWGEQTAPVS